MIPLPRQRLPGHQRWTLSVTLPEEAFLELLGRLAVVGWAVLATTRTAQPQGNPRWQIWLSPEE